MNIEGLVAGYTGPGGKTMLPARAVAKLDLRLVPDMTYDGAVAALKAHLAKRGFSDIEVNPSGGYNPTSTPADAAVIRAQLSLYKRLGLDPVLWPRNAGSYPGYVFTDEPLRLAAGALRPGPRQRRPRTQRVLRHRVLQPEGRGLGRGSDVARAVPARAGDDRLRPRRRFALR